MSRFDSRFERLELKYLIDEGAAERIRRDIEPFCRADDHNPVGPDAPRGYDVSSLYLDTPALAFYRAKERGDPERIKLRVRRYGRSPLATLECKRRVVDVIDKTRVLVDANDCELASRGGVDPGVEQPEARHFMNDFASRVARSGAEPLLLVRYQREAYVSEVDHYARVTFDRGIEAHRTRSWRFEPEGDAGVRFDDHWPREERWRSVVLELKCQSRVPCWMMELIRRRRLKRLSFSKYAIGVHLTARALGADLLARRSARWMA